MIWPICWSFHPSENPKSKIGSDNAVWNMQFRIKLKFSAGELSKSCFVHINAQSFQIKIRLFMKACFITWNISNFPASKPCNLTGHHHCKWCMKTKSAFTYWMKNLGCVLLSFAFCILKLLTYIHVGNIIQFSF